MSNIRFGLQTYSWQMSYEKYRGRIDHIADIGEAAGFIGMEAEVCMLDALFPHVEQVRGSWSATTCSLRRWRFH